MLHLCAPLVCSTGVLHLCAPLVCSTGVLHWCAPLVCSTGVLHWCAPLVCSTGVLHWCAPLVCSTCVLHWCAPLVYSTGVLHWCAPLVCKASRSPAVGTAFLTTNSSTCRTIAEGDPLSLRCTVRHTYIGRYNIEWFRANSHSGCCARRTSDSSFWSIPKERTVKTFRQDEKSVEVIIPRFTNKHEGVYFCRLTSILNDEKQVSEPIEVRLSKSKSHDHHMFVT